MRKNIVNLTTSEWDAVVTAFNRIKANGTYDAFTRRHNDTMMMLTRYPGETNTQRNIAHNGPAFLPWHRKSLREFEAALGVHLPYWNWESTGSSWRSSAVWNRVGGNGNSSQSYRVTTGPFAGWNSIVYNSSTSSYVPRTGIIRQFDGGGSMNPVSISLATYDVSPWNELVSESSSWRRHLELAHNNVHRLVGGGMRVGTSPNDPLFWFHHCNVDRIWWRWQARNGFGNYAPTSGAPLGHNKPDVLRGLQSTNTTISSMLDARVMGVTYDTLG